MFIWKLAGRTELTGRTKKSMAKGNKPDIYCYLYPSWMVLLSLHVFMYRNMLYILLVHDSLWVTKC